jgi:signal peptidase I
MNFDFSLILSVLAGFSGLIWLIDALFFAKGRAKLNAALAEGELPAKENWVTEQAKSFFPVLMIVLVVRSFWFEPFQIPSNSMLPTLLTGDFLVVNKYAYGIRLPVVNTKIIDIGKPERGDVVIFRRPARNAHGEKPLAGKELEDEKNSVGLTFIKRCIGLPGDRVQVVGKELYVNGQQIAQTDVDMYVNDAQSSNKFLARIYNEDLLGRKHQVLHSDFPQLTGDWTVPEGMYFMIGDNRDGSSDSRDWGFVPEANLMGRASFIWMHFDSQRDGIVAWKRIGKRVQ